MNMSRYLYVFNYVLSNGTKRQGKYHFGELSAWHDFDGYTCYIGYKDLTMSFTFIVVLILIIRKKKRLMTLSY